MHVDSDGVWISSWDTERRRRFSFLSIFLRPDRNFFHLPSDFSSTARPASERARARVSRVSRNSNRRRVDVTLPFDLIGQPTPAITAAFLPSFPSQFPSFIQSELQMKPEEKLSSLVWNEKRKKKGKIPSFVILRNRIIIIIRDRFGWWRERIV